MAADHLKDKITPSMKANDGLKISQYAALHHIREKLNHYENSPINYWNMKMDKIPCLPYPQIQHWLSWKIFLAGSTIVLQLLVSGYFTVISILYLLSQYTIWTTVALMVTKNNNIMITKDYWNKLGFSPERLIKMSFRSEIHHICLII